SSAPCLFFLTSSSQTCFNFTLPNASNCYEAPGWGHGEWVASGTEDVMMKRVVIAAALAAALAGGSALAIAQPPQGGPGMHGPGGPRGGPGGPMMDFGLRGIDLTDAQKEQVKTIMDSHKSEFDQIRTRMRDAQRAFGDATQADTIDEAAIRTKA